MPRPNSRDPELDLAAALGEELKRVRVAAKFATQDALARALGFAREAISKAETGAELPERRLVRQVARSLHGVAGDAPLPRPHAGHRPPGQVRPLPNSPSPG